jgi:hypothetical protein
MTDLLLISTTDVRHAPEGILDRMLASVARAARSLPHARILHALLLQNCPPGHGGTLPDFVAPDTIETRLSLSAARNRLLGPLVERRSIAPDTVVGFPDDDCWYPPGLLKTVLERFRTDPQLDLWFCRYSSRPDTYGARAERGRPARARDVVRNASSNTMFVRGRVVRRIGRFDEALGVGTPNLGGEDIDFALKAHRLAQKTWFEDAALIGHRDPQPALRARYYPGSLLVLGRHAATSAPLLKEYLRKIGVGLVLAQRGELPLRTFLSANHAALREATGRSHSAACFAAPVIRPARE